ncbi:hypothetical protein [Rhizobium mongolense]|nr:hypothetical protein [Rhizobium mongolense]
MRRMHFPAFLLTAGALRLRAQFVKTIAGLAYCSIIRNQVDLWKATVLPDLQKGCGLKIFDALR